MTDPAIHMDAWKVIAAIRYAYPGLVLLYFVVASTVSVCILQTISSRTKDKRVRRDVIIWLMLSAICLYIIQAGLLILRSIAQKGWFAGTDEIVYLLSSVLVWGLQFLALLDSKFPVWYPYYVNWIATVVVETGFLVGYSTVQRPVEVLDFISISIQCVRICTFISLYSTYVLARGHHDQREGGDEERQSLLRNDSAPTPPGSEEPNQGASQYGATTSSAKNGSKKKTDDEEAEEDFYFKREREGAEKIKKRLEAEGNWWQYCKAFFVFFPLIWPVHSKTLQLRAILTGACLLTSNSLNLLVPRQLGVVIDALVTSNGGYVWTAVGIYAVLNFINSNACIGWLQFWLWQPLEQYSYEAINAAAHAHVMSLSSEFHESRTSGDIHQTISQGKGIRKIVDTLFFNLIPTFIDLFLVFVYLYYLFGPYMALNLATTTILYLYTTAKLVAFAAQRRRIYHTYFRKEWMSALSSVGNWRVASYFNQIPYEHDQHHSNIKAHLRSEKSYDAVYYITSVSQNLVMTLGLLGACLLAVYQVMHKVRSPGDFIILLTYWAQLRAPLATFSNLYKSLSEGLMDAERMLEIFQTEPKVADRDDAKPLNLTKGDIQLRNVKFAYDDRKETLKGINLKIEGGSTVAVVGETGSGKSTILKLLHRFYDVKDGSIEIDGQDVREITTKSLRENIAVVPQEPTLFNETIMSNLRYAKLNATDEEVYEACKSAEIHDKIVSMPDAYDYKIGNTAVKLSGGEQQRLAIARAILKNSAIILLDEATSAVDTETEQKIQEALNRLCHGRTTVIVAHRLSTIMRADHIVVMKDGSIIEHGSHENLLRLKGKYFDLWANQISLLNPDDKSGSKPMGSQPDSHHQDKTGTQSLRERSKSPKKDKGGVEFSEVISKNVQNDKTDIVNDLGLERNQVELVKLVNMVKPADGSTGTVISGTSKHRKLKANAPSFYPRHLRSDTESAEGVLGESSKEVKKQEEKFRRSHASLAKRAAKNAGNLIGNLSDIEERRDDLSSSANSAAPESSQGAASATTDAKDCQPRWRRPKKCNQRHLSKSEPAGQDGTNDYDDPLAFSLGESHSLLRPSIMHTRRVSAPSDPISNQQDSRNSSVGVRPRRGRHWRIKNRQSSNSGSASTSATTSSVDASMDEATLPNPPTTTPAEGIQSAGVEVPAGSKIISQKE